MQKVDRPSHKLFTLLALATFVSYGLTPACAAPFDDGRTILKAETSRVAGPELLALLRSSDPAIAARAELALGRIGDVTQREALRPMLAASDARVRAMAAYALGLLLDAQSLVTLRQLATADANSAVRYAAVDAIGRVLNDDASRADDAVAQDVQRVVASDADANVRGHAAAQFDVFRASPNAAGYAALLEADFGNEHDPDVRWHLVWVLARAFPQQASRTFLLAALKDPAELVRLEAVKAWSRRTDADAAATVRPLLSDPSWRVQLEAREALLRLAKLPATQHLTQLPPDLNLPPLPALSSLPPVPAPRGSPSGPALEDVPAAPAFAPTSAAVMNGPMPGLHPRVRFTTTKGSFVVRFYPEWAPLTVASFLKLAKLGYFDGNRWFRIVPDFVVQSGDPKDGEGDPGFTIRAEENPVEQRSGVIAMGLEYENGHAKRDSAGSEFYVTLSPQLYLDRDFTVFGEVESGFDVLAHSIESDRIVRVERIADD